MDLDFGSLFDDDYFAAACTPCPSPALTAKKGQKRVSFAPPSTFARKTPRVEAPSSKTGEDSWAEVALGSAGAGAPSSDAGKPSDVVALVAPASAPASTFSPSLAQPVVQPQHSTAGAAAFAWPHCGVCGESPEQQVFCKFAVLGGQAADLTDACMRCVTGARTVCPGLSWHSVRALSSESADFRVCLQVAGSIAKAAAPCERSSQDIMALVRGQASAAAFVFLDEGGLGPSRQL